MMLHQNLILDIVSYSMILVLALSYKLLSITKSPKYYSTNKLSVITISYILYLFFLAIYRPSLILLFICGADLLLYRIMFTKVNRSVLHMSWVPEVSVWYRIPVRVLSLFTRTGVINLLLLLILNLIIFICLLI